MSQASHASLLATARRIAPLAWPVFIGQVAVLAFGTVDTVMVARYSSLDLAALAVGGAAYVSIFVGLMGVVLAISPIAGQLFGAGREAEAGRQLHQTLWLAMALSVLGCSLLLFPAPFLAIAKASPEVAERVRGYLGALAFALPASLMFTAFRGFNTAISRPKVVMVLQLCALVVKVPLNGLLVFGADLATPWGALHLPAFGAQGCGIATAIVQGVILLIAWRVLRTDPFYQRFQLPGRGLAPPDLASLKELLRLGVPMGLSIAIEVTGFTFMALFISRLGTTPVAGHQIAVNMVSLMFMLPMALANATSTLVAQRIGADDAVDAERIGWHGLAIAVLIASGAGASVYLLRQGLLRAYTSDELVIAAALPLLGWVMLFHIADAAQTMAAFTLRAYRIATAPLVIYATAIWGVGLGGGYVLAFDTTGLTPPGLEGARGFWSAATAGLVVSSIALTGFLAWMLRQRRGTAPLSSMA